MFEKLFSPITIRGMELKNRVMLPAMGTKASYVTDQLIDYHVARVKGGCGLNMVEVCSVHTPSAPRGFLSISEDEYVPGLKKLTDAIHAEGGKAGIQLWQGSMAVGMDQTAQILMASDMPMGPGITLPGITVEQIKEVVACYGKAAKRAAEAGFDCIEFHCAHNYLPHSFLSGGINHRTDEYGGSFENRTRLLRNGIQAAKAYETDQFLVTARIGIYDGFAYPYGFGVKEGEGIIPNLEEPIRLIRELHEDYQMPMVNLTMGNPYVSIHVTRPYDMGKYIPDEHPLYGIARMIHGIGEVKKAVPQMAISASAPTYLRQYSDLYAAGAIEEGLCDQMLFGRLSFANPDFPNQIRDTGRIDPKKVCVTCGKCGDLIRAGKPTGCVVRNPENYLKYYREYQEENR